MLQDQKTQMTHSNNTIIEEVSEQQLHVITGGCSDCQALAEAAALQAKTRDAMSANHTTARWAVSEAKKAIKLEKLSTAASKTVNAPVPAGEECCQHYKQHLEVFKPLSFGKE